MKNYQDYKLEFYNSENGKNLKKRLNRLIIIGIIGILFSIYLIIFNTNKWDIVSGGILIIASIFFITESIILRRKRIKEYILKQK